VTNLLTLTLNPSVDVSAQIPVVEPDRKMHCSAVCFEPGGGGVNVARVAHALGAEVAAVILVGGGSGDRLVALLAHEGVATESVAIADGTRTSLTVLESSTGRQYRFVLPGPAISPPELTEACERIAALAVDTRRAVVSGSVPLSISASSFAAVLQRIRDAGAKLIVDTSGPALIAAATVGTELLKPSRRELAEFAGHDFSSDAQIEGAARRLLAIGGNGAVVVSLGAAGALLVRAHGETRRIHAPSVRVVSTVGAGDSLVAGMAVALERGSDLEEATRWGVAAGTAATLSPGTGLCRRADVERLVAQVVTSPLAAR
jgi:6-phosphofructokinase 2